MTPRWLLATALLTLGGCGGAAQQERLSPSPVTASSADHAAAMLGTWSSGQDLLVLGDDGTYMWECEQACDLPPCPIDQTSGSYEVEGKALRLATVTGPDLLMAFELGSDPRRVALRHPDGRAWTLRFVE